VAPGRSCQQQQQGRAPVCCSACRLLCLLW
jgi:hypothetical protein